MSEKKNKKMKKKMPENNGQGPKEFAKELAKSKEKEEMEVKPPTELELELIRLKKEKMFHVLQLKHETYPEQNLMTAIGFGILGNPAAGEPERMYVDVVYMTNNGLNSNKIPLGACNWKEE